MVRFLVVLEDPRTGEETDIALPITDFELTAYEGYEVSEYISELTFYGLEFEELININNAIRRINKALPEMTDAILEAIELETGFNILDDTFVDQLCDGEFMLDQLDGDVFSAYHASGFSIRECAAIYLATERCIQFSETISIDELAGISFGDMEQINWLDVWKAYESLGFLIIDTGYDLFVGNFQ